MSVFRPISYITVKLNVKTEVLHTIQRCTFVKKIHFSMYLPEFNKKILIYESLLQVCGAILRYWQ